MLHAARSYLDGAPVCINCDANAECKEVDRDNFRKLRDVIDNNVASSTYTITAIRKVLGQSTFFVMAGNTTMALTEAGKRARNAPMLQWQQAEIANCEIIKVEKVGAT